MSTVGKYPAGDIMVTASDRLAISQKVDTLALNINDRLRDIIIFFHIFRKLLPIFSCDIAPVYCVRGI